MKVYGLIGKSLKHSFSSEWFNRKFKQEGIDAVYRNFELAGLWELKDLIGAIPELQGLNVTIPFKKEILEYTDLIDNSARIGAVNTIKISRSASGIKTTGFNTDIAGFQSTLKPLLRPDIKALVIGSGGAAQAVMRAFQIAGIPYRCVSRNQNECLQYEDLNEKIIIDHLLIVNCTPLGMFPDVNSYPDIPYHFLTKQHAAYDLIYNPEETLFLKKAREAGATVKNGLDMLHAQAEASWKIWSA